MVTETEGTFKIGDKSLYTKTWLVSIPPNFRHQIRSLTPTLPTARWQA